MPELPEVHTFQQFFDAATLQQKIVDVQVSDDKIFRNISGLEFSEKVRGSTIIGSYRRGKYLFGALDNNHHIQLHFGMTGDLKLYRESEDAPHHERFHFQFSDGMKLGFDCPRKFARICYVENLTAYLMEINLGPDALEISESDFLIGLINSRATIKGRLLDQSFLSGIGNLYADEVLFQARVHPASVSSAISTRKQKEIYRRLRDILKAAVERRPHYKEYPENWYWQWRIKGSKGPKGKGIIHAAKIGGRTTYFCNAWQKKYQ